MNTSTFKKQCQGFIFNWPRVSENAKALQKQFTDIGIDVTVINSDESENDNGLKNWVNIGKDGYMVQQYGKALELFNRTFFLGMFADIYDVEAEHILERACYTFNTYNCGVYAPNADYNFWAYDRERIPKLEKDLYQIINPDSLLTIVHKDVLEEVHLDTEKYSIGWGIDFLISVHAHLKNKIVICDYSTTVRHPESKGYDGQKAHDEFAQFIKEQPKNVATLMRQFRREARSLLLIHTQKDEPKTLTQKMKAFFQ